MSLPRSPTLSEEEWAVVEAFLGHPVTDRDAGAHAFWEDTYANDHNLLDNFKRLAWLGDRVLNLALADRRERNSPPMARWNGTTKQDFEQSESAAVELWQTWPEPMRALLRLGNTKQGEVNDRICGTYVEAIVGLLFRAHGYDTASAFVLARWPFRESKG